MTQAIKTADTERVYSAMMSVEDSYSRFVSEFVAWLRDNGHGLTVESFGAYVSHLDTTCASANTYNVKLCAVKKRVRWLFDKSPDSFDVVKRLQLERVLNAAKMRKIASVAVAKDKILSTDEIQTLIACLHGNTTVPVPAIPGGKSVAYMVEFLAESGCRVSEMLTCKLDNVKNAVGREYHNVRIMGKGSKERILMVNSGLIDRIRTKFAGTKYLFEHSGKRYDRNFVSATIRQAGRVYLNREIGAHTFRHSFATAKLKKHDAHAVGTYLGHSSPATTLAMYSHNVLEWDDLRE